MLKACEHANSADTNSMNGAADTAVPTVREKDSAASGPQASATLLDMAATVKNRAAVSLGKRRAALAAAGEMAEIGKLGGKKGGAARAKALSARRRKEIARKAAAARWGKEN